MSRSHQISVARRLDYGIVQKKIFLLKFRNFNCPKVFQSGSGGFSVEKE